MSECIYLAIYYMVLFRCSKANVSFRLYSCIFVTSVNNITFFYQFPQIQSSIKKAGHQFDSFMLTISLPLSIVLRQVCDILLYSCEYIFFVCPQSIMHIYINNIQLATHFYDHLDSRLIVFGIELHVLILFGFVCLFVCFLPHQLIILFLRGCSSVK